MLQAVLAHNHGWFIGFLLNTLLYSEHTTVFKIDEQMILGGVILLMVQSGGKHLSLVVEACCLQDFSHQQYETQYSKLLRVV